MFTNICNQSKHASEPDIDANPTLNKRTQFTTKKVMGTKMEDGYSVFDAKALYEQAKMQCDSVINRKYIDFDPVGSSR